MHDDEGNMENKDAMDNPDCGQYSVCNSDRTGYSRQYAASEWKVNDELSIRPITLKDTGYIVRWRNDPRVKHNFIYQGTFTDESHNEWIRTKVFTGQVRQFIMEMMPGHQPVGSVYLRDIDMTEKKAEYGIFIGEDKALHHRFGTLAAEWAVRYAREEMHLDPLIIRILADNPASLTACEHAGYRVTETVPDYVCIDGKWHDVVFLKIVL